MKFIVGTYLYGYISWIFLDNYVQVIFKIMYFKLSILILNKKKKNHGSIIM